MTPSHLVDLITNQTITVDKITILEVTVTVMEIKITLEDPEIILEAKAIKTHMVLPAETQTLVEAATNLHMEMADPRMIEETTTITTVVHSNQEDQDHLALVIT